MKTEIIKADREAGTAKTVVHLFDSVAQGFFFREALTHNPELSEKHQGYLAAHTGPDRWTQHWAGCDSEAEFKERVTRGWTDGADKLQALATREIQPTSIRRRRVRADQGDELDIHSVYRGDLSRAWSRTKRQARQGTNRLVTLVCNIAASSGTDSSELFWRGASALKLVEALEESGFTVRLVAGLGGEGIEQSGQRLDTATLVEVKAEDQPLNVADLAAIVAMPGYFRTVGFASILYAAHVTKRTVCSSLGRPSPRTIERAVKTFYPEANAIIQPAKVLNKESAERWIDDVLTSLDAPE